MGSHRHAYTVGFATMMILGVASRVVPILAGVDSDRVSRLWGPFILLNVGCVGRVLLQVLTDFFPAIAFPLVGLTGFIEALALGWRGMELWCIMNVSRSRRGPLLRASLSVGIR
jgi:hypothetical protein